MLNDLLTNLRTAVQEGGAPHAVSRTTHEYVSTSDRTGVFMWMGKTAVENAQSGYKFHISEAAHKRVDVEVDEAHHAQDDLRPGMMKFFISPRMSEFDADYETAKKEHLADDDAVRASWLLLNERGQVKERVLQSLLVKDVPLQAWVDMLQDPQNPFGKRILVENMSSALSIMKTHRELEVPLGALSDGPVDILRVVSSYITDMDAKTSVLDQISNFERDQLEIEEKTDYIAREWRNFEIELSESSFAGKATPEVKNFIDTMRDEWSDDDWRVIANHQYADDYIMTDQLMAIIEDAKQNTLWTRAGILTGNEAVIEQIEPQVLQQLMENEQQMYRAIQANDIGLAQYIESGSNRLIAQQHVQVGSGCVGLNTAFSDMHKLLRALFPDMDDSETLDSTDGSGTLTFLCTKGHVNIRPHDKTIDCCTTCGASVSCK